jgi:predicted NBD/HSP70 family sugar kinase
MGSQLAIGVDIGGTKIAFVLTDELGTVIENPARGLAKR